MYLLLESEELVDIESLQIRDTNTGDVVARIVWDGLKLYRATLSGLQNGWIHRLGEWFNIVMLDEDNQRP